MDAILNTTFFNYLIVALGLGFVIFIHELGHFLVAKWCGVKVEMFALGFGPAVIAWRKGIGVRLGSTMPAYVEATASREANPSQPGPPLGETEYSIRAIPLGGFVKMLGEGEEADSENARTTDPRAYSNKSVAARMAIISAGVVMNVISGLIFFAIAYGRGGLPEVPARISAVMAGFPAYEAGLRAGDEIVAVDGRDDLDFIGLKRLTAMSGADQVLRLSVRRPGEADLLRIDVEPTRQGDAEMKTMGILPPVDLVLAKPPFLAPAGLEDAGRIAERFRVGDRVVASGPEGVQPTPVADVFELNEILARHRDVPISVVVERGSSSGSDAVEPSESPSRVTVTLPVVPFVDLGFRLEMGPISAIRPQSPAAEAGFKAGDRIVGVEGLDEIDPMRLPDFLYDRAGTPVLVRVIRSEGGKPEEERSLTVIPEAISSWVEPHVGNEPLDVAAIGLAYPVGPKIVAVRPDSPAAQAGLEAGDAIRGLTLSPPSISGQDLEDVALDIDNVAYAWPAAFDLLQSFPRHSVGVRISGVDKTYRLTPEPDTTWLDPRRGLQFQTLHRPMPPLSLSAALSRGLRETTQTIRDVYAMFRSLFQGLISPKALGGPIMIADMASQTARAGLEAFLQFLGMLSLNLAVINFLPIPPLDGGQMTFLIAELFRGRPLPEKALSAGTIVGLMLVLTLMVFVFYQDIMRYILG